jgi:hypothetical protein
VRTSDLTYMLNNIRNNSRTSAGCVYGS